MITSSTSPSKQLTKKEQEDMSEIMAKLLNIPKKEILKSIWQFSNIDPKMKGCFCKLYKMDKKDYVSALMLLDYLLVEGNHVLDLIKD